MTRAMLPRVKRMEAAVRPARLAVGAAQSGGDEFMRRLAVYPDLFDEFMDTAERAQSGAGDAASMRQQIGLLSDGLTAREARACRLRSAQNP